MSNTVHTTRGRAPRRTAEAFGVTLVAVACFLAAPSSGAQTGEATKLEDYRMRGLQAAMQTKGALGGELMKAMEAGGPEGAVAFCNTRALPITREMSTKLGVEVSRVSDQPRNPVNAADAEDLEIIATFKEALATGQQPVPALREHENAVIGYYPIVTNGMCLTCHGARGVDINPATQAAIDRAYPQDRATGYGDNELRGLFVVHMNREDSPAPALRPEEDEDD